MQPNAKPQYRRDLYLLLPDVKNARVAEVGVAEGNFARDMLNWGIKCLYLIDMWEHSPGMFGDAANPQEWHNRNYDNTKMLMALNFKDWQSYEFLRGPSHKMAEMIANESLDLVNIDADHTYEGVRRDSYAFWPKLKSGGVISFHDFFSIQYGVRRAVEEFAGEMRVEVNLIPEDKPEDGGAWLRKP